MRKGAPSPVSAELVQRIVEICHTIVVDDILWEKLDEQLNRPGYQLPQMQELTYSVFFGTPLRSPTRWTGWVILRLPSMKRGRFHPGATDDTYIVRLAVESGAILVTTDGPLRDDLRELGIQDTYGLTVVSPDEALGEL